MIQDKFKVKTIFTLLFCLAFFSNSLNAQDADDPPIKVDTLLLTIPLTVSDSKGRYIAGLKKENFSIFQDGEEQYIDFFFNEEAPMNVAILLDTSYSTKDVLDNIQKAARDFLRVLRPEDKALIVSFDHQTRFLSGLTSDRRLLSNAIKQAQITNANGSDMHEAISHVINNFFGTLKGRKAIIVLTDGIVTGRDTSAQTILNKLQKADTLFYPIIFKTKQNYPTKSRNKRPLPIDILEILAQETAGRFYEKEATKLREAFESIAEELKKQYLLGFYPEKSETENSSKHIRVTVDRKDLTVRVKKKLVF